MTNSPDPTPGSFHDDDEPLGFSGRKMPAVPPPELEFTDDLFAIYTAFRDQVYSPRSVLYPSCGFDASPSRAFPNVTFVDLEDGNNGCIEKLCAAGLRAIKTDIRTYVPHEEHDLLILLNPVVPPEWATRHLIPGGYVIANDWHRSATTLHEDPAFTLVSVIDFIEPDRRKNDYRVHVSTDLTDLFEPVENAEEFKRLRPHDFDVTKLLVEQYITAGGATVDAHASFDEQWGAFRTYMESELPSKRAADRYVFRKRIT